MRSLSGCCCEAGRRAAVLLPFFPPADFFAAYFLGAALGAPDFAEAAGALAAGFLAAGAAAFFWAKDNIVRSG